MSLKSASNLEHREPTLLSDISIYLCLSLYLKYTKGLSNTGSY